MEEVTTLLGAGASIGIFIIAIGILWFLLCFILFFKIWAMTNDVNEIKNMFKEQLNLEHPYVDDSEPAKDTEGKVS